MEKITHAAVPRRAGPLNAVVAIHQTQERKVINHTAYYDAGGLIVCFCVCFSVPARCPLIDRWMGTCRFNDQIDSSSWSSPRPSCAWLHGPWSHDPFSWRRSKCSGDTIRSSPFDIHDRQRSHSRTGREARIIASLCVSVRVG